MIGKYGGEIKATEAATALLPLPSRERVGVRVHRGAAFPPSPSPPLGERVMQWNTSRAISDQGQESVRVMVMKTMHAPKTLGI